MEKQRRGKRLLILAGVLAVAAAGVFAAVDRSNIKYQFPMWLEAAEQEGVPEVTITLDRIDFGAGSGDTAQDAVHVTLHSAVDNLCIGVGCRVDYFSGGAWYTVYTPNGVPDIGRILGGPGEIPLEYNVPAGLFRQKGQYRFYVDTLGYCEISIK